MPIRSRAAVLCLAAIAPLACTPLPALAEPDRVRDRAMLELAPEARIEQRCNAKAMGAVAREHKGFHPDELVAYAFGDPTVGDNEIDAPGAALRSKGQWFHIAYHCRTTADGLEVEAFRYTLGEVIPRAEWDAHALVE